MARNSSRSRADQPQSNTVLIVFLVFSILLNLGLGVFLYLSQDKIDQAVAKENSAVSQQKKMEEQRNAATNTYIPLLRSVVGDPSLTTDELNNMKEGLTRDTGVLPQPWYEGKSWKELMGRGQNDPGLIGPFSATTGKPAITLIDKIRQLNEQLAKSTEKLKATEAGLAKVNTDFTKYKGEWNDLIFAQRLKAAQDSNEVDKQNKIKQQMEVNAAVVQKLQDTNNEMEKTVKELKSNYDTVNTTNAEKFAAKSKAESEEYRKKLNAIESDKLTSLNVPKARIVSYDPHTDMAVIDLGSAVRLPLGLTFSVHEHDANGTPNPRKKAEVVVVKILGDQLAQVRVTRMAKPDTDRVALPSPNLTADEEKRYWDSYFTSDPRDFNRTNRPIYKGDYLFNVVWDPTKRVQVALVGEFDLNGDGTDDLQSLISLLRAQGAEVVLYLDKANGYKPKGKLDHNTDVVVLGEIPTTVPGGAKQQVSVNRATEMIREGLAVQKEANELGLRVVQLPRFLSEMGISVPQILHSSKETNHLPAQPAPAAPPAEDKKEADPKPGQ